MRQINKVYKYNGQERTVREWSNILGLSYDCLISRLKRHRNDLSKVFHREYAKVGCPKGTKSWRFKWGPEFTPEYNAWWCMINRCTNRKSTGYKNYGFRGIKVCKRWMKFDNFLADMGARPSGYSLERVENNKDYTPDNCIWATRRTQANNTRRNIFLTLNGKKQTAIQWSIELNIKPGIIWSRHKKGWPVELILSKQKFHPTQMRSLLPKGDNDE